LRTLARKFDQGDEHYTVQHVGAWSVVADSSEAFEAVRDASTGTSLADTEEFKQAVTRVDSDAVAFAYANGALAKQLPANIRPLVGPAKWFTAQLRGHKNELKLDVHAVGSSSVEYKPELLRDVPSGAILAVSFKNASELPFAFLKPYLKGIDGEGVLYIVPGAILPVIALEVRPTDPAAAIAAFRRIAAQVGRNVPLNVERRGNKVLLTTAQRGLGTGGKSIVDDKSFKDALAAADVPETVSWLAYADIQRLRPLVEAFGPLLQRDKAKRQVKLPPDLNTLTAYGASGRTGARVTLR
jgi:hypothetical protein